MYYFCWDNNDCVNLYCIGLSAKLGTCTTRSMVNMLVEKNAHLKVTYHPVYSMNNFVTNKSKMPQDGAQLFPYMG